MKALRQTAQSTAVIDQVPIPVPGPDEVLVKIYAVALSPYDWKMLYGQAPPVPTVLGCDFAGVIETVGQNVTRVKPQDRVAGMVQGRNILRPDDGAFVEYAVAPAHVLLHLPQNLSFEDGVTVPIPAFTAGFCLEHVMGVAVPKPASEPGSLLQGGEGGAASVPNGPAESNKGSSKAPILLVYGGASSSGLMLVQMGKL